MLGQIITKYYGYILGIIAGVAALILCAYWLISKNDNYIIVINNRHSLIVDNISVIFPSGKEIQLHKSENGSYRSTVAPEAMGTGMIKLNINNNYYEVHSMVEEGIKHSVLTISIENNAINFGILGIGE